MSEGEAVFPANVGTFCCSCLMCDLCGILVEGCFTRRPNMDVGVVVVGGVWCRSFSLIDVALVSASAPICVRGDLFGAK